MPDLIWKANKVGKLKVGIQREMELGFGLERLILAEEAALAYDQAALSMCGPSTCLNFQVEIVQESYEDSSIMVNRVQHRLELKKKQEEKY
ncbi:hypothetical protein MTR67_046525 [Solanum verrucosum]|uniref:AP2/ERF domain-containing protein n=1 Tax=Solanum verrucosum TaxID=315347 RepID=A0AAF0UUQ8_SOLVR|nr:hypothetical protein MTR67_046525 [Solanum verrucosum]